jgi:hypothetical protein
MSRGRSNRATTHKLVPKATLVVPENEAKAYEPLGLEIVPIPPERIGVSAVRNWIVRKFPEDVVMMYDDDVTGCRTLCGLRNRELTSIETEAMVENTAYCAAGAGARLFGWNQRPDPRMLQRNDPVSVVHWCGGVLGVIGKEVPDPDNPPATTRRIRRLRVSFDKAVI